MTSSRLLRLSGLSLLAGSVAFVLHVVLRSVITAGRDPDVFARHGARVPVQVLGVVGAVQVLLGLPGIMHGWLLPLACLT